MWIFNSDGFFSAVQHDRDFNTMLVRARYKKDILKLRVRVWELDHIRLRVQSTPKADYPFRVTMSRKMWAKYVMHMAYTIDYTNFKSAVHDPQDEERNGKYMDVWAAMKWGPSLVEEGDW